MNKIYFLRHFLAFMACNLFMSVPNASAVALYTNDFSTGAQGWSDRDVGEMTFTNSSGYIEGAFDQDVFSPEMDAFRSGNIGDVTQGGTYSLTSFSFEFYAVNVVPSVLVFSFSDGTSTFSTGLSVSGTGSWLPYILSLTSLAGWSGGDQSAFDAALGNITFVELEILRNGEDAQTYRLDNFQINGDLTGGGGGGPSAVPEPTTISLLLMIVLLLGGLRRFRIHVGKTA